MAITRIVEDRANRFSLCGSRYFPMLRTSAVDTLDRVCACMRSLSASSRRRPIGIPHDGRTFRTLQLDLLCVQLAPPRNSTSRVHAASGGPTGGCRSDTGLVNADGFVAGPRSTYRCYRSGEAGRPWFCRTTAPRPSRPLLLCWPTLAAVRYVCIHDDIAETECCC